MSEYKSFAEFPTFVSYDLCGIDESFDVALVDGPIVYQFGDGTRIVPVSWCLERLKEGRAVYLDDAHRPQEKAVIAAIKKSRPDIEVELTDTKQGLCKFTTSDPASVFCYANQLEAERAARESQFVGESHTRGSPNFSRT
jgi:hypothetical protein